MNMHTADKILKVRKLHDLTQEEFSEKLNLSAKTISRMENGKDIFRSDVIIQLYEIFGITPNELFGIESANANKLRFLKDELTRLAEAAQDMTIGLD